MPKGKKHKFTKKQDRQAMHIADSEMAKGMGEKQAKSVGYATVNKNKKAKGRKFNSKKYENTRKKLFNL